MNKSSKIKKPAPTFGEMQRAAHNPQLLEEIHKFAHKLCERLYLVRSYGRPEIRCFKDPDALQSHVDIVAFYFYCSKSHIRLRYSDLNRNLQGVNIRNLNDFKNIKQTIIDGYDKF